VSEWGTPSLTDRVVVDASRFADARCVWLWKLSRAALPAAALAVSLVFASSALASRAPTQAERAAIVGASPKAAYPASWYRFVVRVSSVNPNWAIIHVEPTTGHEAQVQLDFGLLHRSAHGWQAHGISCGWRKGVPAAVVRDLRVPC
jgi:hypothetical protein